MNVSAELGMNQDFALTSILLVYSSGHRAFATLHEPQSSPDGGPPYLNEGRPLTMEFLKELGRQLGASLPKEILPGNVLVRTVEMLAWWTPHQQRVLFYGDASDGRTVNGKSVPVPPLVFKVLGSELSIRALTNDQRPGAATKLMCAPFWNVDTQGNVCQGSMRAPSRLTLDAIPLWERAFFESEFTHAAMGAKLTKHPEGFLGLWRDLAGRRAFPSKYLVDSGETLQTFIGPGRN
jgi:PRTRC genetic system protein B